MGSQREELFAGSEVSSHDCSITLLSIMNKHCLTYSAMEDIIKLFCTALPTPNTLPQSQHLLMKNFVSYDSDTKVHHSCGHCTQLLPLGSLCPRAECQRAGIADATFVEVFLDKQIQTLFSGN